MAISTDACWGGGGGGIFVSKLAYLLSNRAFFVSNECHNGDQYLIKSPKYPPSHFDSISKWAIRTLVVHMLDDHQITVSYLHIGILPYYYVQGVSI